MNKFFILLFLLALAFTSLRLLLTDESTIQQLTFNLGSTTFLLQNLTSSWSDSVNVVDEPIIPTTVETAAESKLRIPTKAQCSQSTRIYVEPHPCKFPPYLPEYDVKRPEFFYQFSLEVLLLRKWREFGFASGNLLSTAVEYTDQPADIVVVPGMLAGMWVCRPNATRPDPADDTHLEWAERVDWSWPVPTEDEAQAYWDGLRTKFCRGLDSAPDSASKPACPVIVTHNAYVVAKNRAAIMFTSLLKQPHYFQGRVVIAGIESNLPISMSNEWALFRHFKDVVGEISPKAFRTRPLFISVPYPTFELPDVAASAAIAMTQSDLEKRNKLVSSSWAPTCLGKSNAKKDEYSGGVRSGLESFMHNHTNSSRRGSNMLNTPACKFNQHAICVKGKTCLFSTGLDRMHRLVKTSRYCLEPGGDTPTRSHFYVAAIAGCIPIIFDGGSLNYGKQTTRWPFMKVEGKGIGLKYEDFSIILKTEDVARDPSLVMQSIEKSDYYALRIGLANALQSLAYSNNHDTRDAFTLFKEVVCAEAGRNLF